MPRSRFLEDTQGAIAIMAAVFGLLLCALAALAVDYGSMTLKARKIQGAADLAAMAAASNLGRAEVAGTATANANLTDIATIQVIKGSYSANKNLAPDQRFVPGNTSPNAVRVVITSPAPVYFGRVILNKDSVLVTREATAALPTAKPAVMFSIGSRLASLEGGIANALLSGLLGTDISLKVADYRGLADAQINLLQFTDLLSTSVGLKVGEYDKLLTHEVSAGQFLKVLELVADENTRSILGTITKQPIAGKIKLSELLGVELDADEGLRDSLNANVSALDLLMASLETANGNRQLDLNLGADVGLAKVQAMVAIGERPNKSPWLTITDNGQPILSTAQARIYIKAKTADELDGLAQVDLPILVEVAASQARLKSFNCSGTPSATLEALPGVARVAIGKIDETKLKDFTKALTVEKATLLSLLNFLGNGVSIQALADLKVADPYWKSVTFSQSDVDKGKVKSVRSTNFVSGLFISLIRDLKADINIFGLNIGLGRLVNLLAALLYPIAPILDAILQPLLTLLGVKLGEADLQVHAIYCPATGNGPSLVG